MKIFAISAATAVLMPIAATAHDGLAVTDAFARASNPRAGAAFMTIENHKDTACTLIGASSDVAHKVELHTHKDADGVMQMVPIEGGITVPAGGSHALMRGGDHVMMMGLTAPLEDGQIIRLSLDFGDCGMLEVDVPVDNARANHAGTGLKGKTMAPGEDNGQPMKH